MKKILLLLALLLATATAHALPFVTTPSTSTYPIHWYQLKSMTSMYIMTQTGVLTIKFN